MARHVSLAGLHRTSRRVAGNLVPLVLTLFGVVGIVIAGLFVARANHDTAIHAATTMVTITEVIITPADGHAAGSCGAVFRYTVNGRGYVGSTGNDRSSSLCDLQVGDQTVAHYAPGDPADVQLEQVRVSLWPLAAIVSGIPLLLGAIGLSMFAACLLRWRQKARQAQLASSIADRAVTAPVEPEEIIATPAPAGAWEPYRPTQNIEDDLR